MNRRNSLSSLRKKPEVFAKIAKVQAVGNVATGSRPDRNSAMKLQGSPRVQRALFGAYAERRPFYASHTDRKRAIGKQKLKQQLLRSPDRGSVTADNFAVGTFATACEPAMPSNQRAD